MSGLTQIPENEAAELFEAHGALFSIDSKNIWLRYLNPKTRRVDTGVLGRLLPQEGRHRNDLAALLKTYASRLRETAREVESCRRFVKSLEETQLGGIQRKPQEET